MNESDEQEYVTLIAGHQSMLRAFVASLLPGAPGVDDVVQETNVILWKKRETFELGTNFRAWALRIARLQVMTHVRQIRQQRWNCFDDNLAELIADETEELLADERQQNRLGHLRGCLHKLPESDRDLLLRRYWRSQPLREFAIMSGQSLSKIKVRLFRIRAALKRCIENQVKLAESRTPETP